MTNPDLETLITQMKGSRSQPPPVPTPPPLPEEADIAEIGQLLKQERERLGLRVADVHGRSEIDPSLISRLENDPETNPTVSTLRRFAQALNKTIVCRLVDLPPSQESSTKGNTMTSSGRQQKIDAFIGGLHVPPYEMAYPDLARERAEEIAHKYFPRLKSLIDAEVDTMLDTMQESIDENGDHGMIEEWRRTCHGIAEYLLRPGNLDHLHRVVAAECVIRVSGYYHHGAELHGRFRPAARLIGDLIWVRHGIQLPYLQIPVSWTNTVPSEDHEGYVTLWAFAGSQRALASRILCFICQNDYRNVYVPEDEHNLLKKEYNEGAGNRHLLMRWSVSSEYVDRIARVLIVHKQHLMDFLTRRRFNQSQMYKPAAGPRDLWFRTWTHSLPPAPATT